MSSQVIPGAFVERLMPTRAPRWLVEVGVVSVGVLVVALLAKVNVFVGPVPISGQTLGVLLIGAAYGAARGGATMAAYMAVGLLGAPVFAGPVAGPGYLLAPSFGFVIGFIPSAWLVGLLADRGWDRVFWRGLLANLLASVIPFLVGVPYMVGVLAASGAPPTFAQAMEWGVIPFVPGGIVKAAIVACLLPVAWSVHRWLVARNADRDGTAR